MEALAESQGHLLRILGGSEGRAMGTVGAPQCMPTQCSTAWRHLQCRLYANLREGYGHTSWTFIFIQCCIVFILQSLLFFLVRYSWHFVNT